MSKRAVLLTLALGLISGLTTFQGELWASVPGASGEKARIFTIDSLTQVSDPECAEAVYFLDIDDTLLDSAHMLGSKAWRKYISSATEDNTGRNWRDFFSLFIARNHPLETVEACTGQFVRELQCKGHAVFGLTARERTLWYDTPTEDVDLLTVSQLESVGISFKHESLEKAYPRLTDNPEYFRGIFFADIEPKGGFLLELFKNVSPLPAKVIFIDDKYCQVESVANALDQLGISNVCYWYIKTDDKASRFDPLIANIQLLYFWMSDGQTVLSDKEALAVADQCPETQAEYYLEVVLDAVENKSANHSKYSKQDSGIIINGK